MPSAALPPHPSPARGPFRGPLMGRWGLLGLGLGLGLLTGCHDPAQGPTPYRADRVPPARVTGKPETCIPIGAFRETRVRDGRTIDFLTGTGRRGWRNTLPARCPGLAIERSFGFNTSISQLCSMDIIRVLQQTGGQGLMPGAACGLGPFTPIELQRSAQNTVPMAR